MAVSLELRVLREVMNFGPPLRRYSQILFKGTLGVERSAPYWAVLRECGHGPLWFCWSGAAVKLYNSMLSSSSATLTKGLVGRSSKLTFSFSLGLRHAGLLTSCALFRVCRAATYI